MALLINNRQIQSLKPKKNKYQIRTIMPGLTVVVRPSGIKSFRYRDIVIGRCAEMTLSKAIASVQRLTGDGITREKKTGPKKRPGTGTKTPATDQLIDQLFGSMVFSWLATHHFDDCTEKDRAARKRADSMVRNSLLVELGPLPVSKITPEILEKTFIDLVKQGKRDAAGRCRRILETFFNHLVERQIIKRSPTNILEKMVFTGKNAMQI